MYVPRFETVADPQVIAFLEPQNIKMLIDGRFVDAVSGETFPTVDPASGRRIADVPKGDARDVDLAVAAAQKALEHPSWRHMLPADRQLLLLRLADLIEENGEKIAQLETLDQGQLIDVARFVQVEMAVDFIRYMAGWATKLEGSALELSVREPIGAGIRYQAYTRREPVGVVAAIVPWNFPHLMALWKIVPALACGCTVVLKPAEDTPLTAIHLAQLIQKAGFPDGVVNVITGTGQDVGAPLAAHPGVNKVAFTGSTRVGQAIGHAAIENMTRFSLETGGKSPVLVLDDIDPDFLGPNAAMATFFNHGQQCVAGSRVYLPKKRFDDYMQRILDMTDFLKVGSGFDNRVHVGPMVSKIHHERVMGYIERSRQAGATISAGGESIDGTGGFFIRPTVITDVDHAFECVREEIFGPVLTVMPYGTLDELVTLANDSKYGLAASIWSQNISKINMLIPRIQAGTVWVNCHGVFDANLPFGGRKLSGIGKEHGRAAINLFTEEKTVCIAY